MPCLYFSWNMQAVQCKVSNFKYEVNMSCSYSHVCQELNYSCVGNLIAPPSTHFLNYFGGSDC